MKVWRVALRYALLVGLLALLVTALVGAPQLVRTSAGEGYAALPLLEQLKFEASSRDLILKAYASVLVVIGAITTLRQLALSRKQADMDRSAKMTEAFAKAVAHLGSDRPSERLAGVYALARLCRLDPDERAMVLNILSAAVRARDLGSGEVTRAAVAEISEISKASGLPVDLRGASLSGLNLIGLDFSNFDLSGADLRDATMTDVKLNGTNLRAADLSRAAVEGVNFTTAMTVGARGLNLVPE